MPPERLGPATTMVDRLTTRLLFAALLVLSAAGVVHGALTAPTTASAAAVPDAEPRANVTVVSESARFGTLIAWRPNGSLLYYEDEHTKYFDVDPVANESLTVEYAATDTIHTKGPTCTDPPCTRNVIERVNLSTGEVKEVYARYDYREHAGEWHDHERVNATHVLVADMFANQVFMVNTETELVVWLWDAQSEFPVSGGGPYPTDWAHINDIELLDDGRVMVSLRNQDQVVFLNQSTGLQQSWTLGSDDDRATLYEQHNPDYIPRERGGPSVVVADSENGRLVEYQRRDGSWERTWQWRDSRLQWPRDADRLPNGNTLVADTHGKRVLEVGPGGEVVWSVPLSHPYDAERLGTGGESASGASAARLGLDSRTAASDSDGSLDLLALASGVVEWIVPSRIHNAVVYIAPVWMGRPQFLAALVGLGTLLTWGAVELRWWLPPLELGWPVTRSD
jgi:hypothetical protein